MAIISHKFNHSAGPQKNKKTLTYWEKKRMLSGQPKRFSRRTKAFRRSDRSTALSLIGIVVISTLFIGALMPSAAQAQNGKKKVCPPGLPPVVCANKPSKGNGGGTNPDNEKNVSPMIRSPSNGWRGTMTPRPILTRHLNY